MAINFTDHGGTLIQFVRVYLIFWGTHADDRAGD